MPHKGLYEMDRVDRAIADFAVIENPSVSDINHVRVVAQVEDKLDRYRVQGKGMTQAELALEAHNSALLGKHMTISGDPRPHELCDAHAIVSGAHKLAAPMRAVLAWFKRRIDDPINGCWLPRNTAAQVQMPMHLRRAVPHSRIHRKMYYAWLSRLIDLSRISSDAELLRTMSAIRHRLQSGSLPQEIIPQR